jgi:hypothetical protein
VALAASAFGILGEDCGDYQPECAQAKQISQASVVVYPE